MKKCPFVKGAVLFAVFAVLAPHIFSMYAVNEASETVQPDCPPAVASVPKTAVAVGSVGRLIADKKHVLFVACDIGHHAVEPRALLYVPLYLGLRLTALERCTAACPKLGEIEFIAFALVPEVR
jgi:hypothetical protein